LIKILKYHLKRKIVFLDDVTAFGKYINYNKLYCKIFSEKYLSLISQLLQSAIFISLTPIYTFVSRYKKKQGREVCLLFGRKYVGT